MHQGINAKSVTPDIHDERSNAFVVKISDHTYKIRRNLLGFSVPLAFLEYTDATLNSFLGIKFSSGQNGALDKIPDLLLMLVAYNFLMFILFLIKDYKSWTLSRFLVAKDDVDREIDSIKASVSTKASNSTFGNRFDNLLKDAIKRDEIIKEQLTSLKYFNDIVYWIIDVIPPLVIALVAFLLWL